MPSNPEPSSPVPSSPAALKPVPCHCLALRQAARQVTLLYDRHLAEAGLRTTQFSVLMILDRHAPLAVHELARHLVMDRTATGRALRPLARDGLVAIGSGRDARTRALGLTPAGKARLDAARAPWARAQAAFQAAYGAPEAEALRLSHARLVGRA